MLPVHAHATRTGMFAHQVGGQRRALPSPPRTMCRPSHPAAGCGDGEHGTAAFHLGMLLLPSPRRGRGLGLEHGEGKSRLGTRLKHLEEGPAQQRRHGAIGFGKDRLPAALGWAEAIRHGDLGGWKWSKLLEFHLGAAIAAKRPSSSAVTPGHPAARKKDEVPRHP